jgi:hypothetical protein
MAKLLSCHFYVLFFRSASTLPYGKYPAVLDSLQPVRNRAVAARFAGAQPPGARHPAQGGAGLECFLGHAVAVLQLLCVPHHGPPSGCGVAHGLPRRKGLERRQLVCLPTHFHLLQSAGRVPAPHFVLGRARGAGAAGRFYRGGRRVAGQVSLSTLCPRCLPDVHGRAHGPEQQH